MPSSLCSCDSSPNALRSVIAALSVVQLLMELQINFLGVEEIYADSYVVLNTVNILADTHRLHRIMPVLICRLILNLRGVNIGAKESYGDLGSQCSLDVVFTVGSSLCPAHGPTYRDQDSTLSRRITTFIDSVGTSVINPLEHAEAEESLDEELEQ